jgi:uncharacterized protein (DUF2141 family)
MPSKALHWCLVALGGAVLVGGAVVQSRESSRTTGVSHPATLRVVGVKSSDGVLRASLCRETERFPDDCQLRSIARASRGVTLLRFPDVEEGTYAAAVFHDENQDGRLDMHGGRRVPSEGVAFSHDAFGDAGAPSFSQAEFEFVGEEQRLRMHYLR